MIKKHVPSTGEVTVFVYDAGGKLIGEYSTNIETTAPKVQYLTADHPGSPVFPPVGFCPARVLKKKNEADARIPALAHLVELG